MPHAACSAETVCVPPRLRKRQMYEASVMKYGELAQGEGGFALQAVDGGGRGWGGAHISASAEPPCCSGAFLPGPLEMAGTWYHTACSIPTCVLSADEAWTEVIDILTVAAIRFEMLSTAHRSQVEQPRAAVQWEAGKQWEYYSGSCGSWHGWEIGGSRGTSSTLGVRRHCMDFGHPKPSLGVVFLRVNHIQCLG